jgi:Caspase domain
MRIFAWNRDAGRRSRRSEAISNVFATHGDGSPNFAVKLKTSPSETITRATLKGEIESLFSSDPDVALLYFSGHGFINSLGGYIVTPDFRKYDEGVSMDDILKFANLSKAKDKIVVLDSCHSGAFASPTIAGSNLAQLSEGLSVLTASRDSESALEIKVVVFLLPWWSVPCKVVRWIYAATLRPAAYTPTLIKR